jgi:hypothetical protein
MATWDERVDAIDEAARRMTDGEPAADFSARVMGRIAMGSSPRQSRSARARDRRRTRVWILAPFAAAVLLIAVVLFRGVGNERRTSREHAAVGNGAASDRRNERAAGAADPSGPVLRTNPDAAGDDRRATGAAETATVPSEHGQAAAADRATPQLDAPADAAAAHRRGVAADRTGSNGGSNVRADRSGGRGPGPFGPGDAARQLDAANDPSPLDALAPPPLEIAPLTVSPLETAAVAADAALHIPQLDSIPPITIAPLAGEDSQRRFQ